MTALSSVRTALKKRAAFIRTKREIEAEMIRNALAETGNNKTRAARLIKMPRSTFFRKLRDYGIDL